MTDVNKFKQFEINNQEQVKAGYYIVTYLADDGEGNTVADLFGLGNHEGQEMLDVQDHSSWDWYLGMRLN